MKYVGFRLLKFGFDGCVAGPTGADGHIQKSQRATEGSVNKRSRDAAWRASRFRIPVSQQIF